MSLPDSNFAGEVSDFVYTGSGWTLTKNGKVETVDEVYDSATTETIETRSIRNSSNALVSRAQTVYRDFPWMKRVKIREINDPDGKALTTRWSYYEQKSDQINYRRLKQVVHPNGYWERYEYSSRGRTKTVAQFLNAPVGAPENQSKVTLTIYGDGSDKEIVALLGTEISRTYTVQGAGYTSIVRCQTPGAPQDAADNLVTTTWFYASGVGKGKRQKIARPDGTISLYTYTTGSNGEETTEISEGAPGAGGNSVGDGTRTVTTENEAGTVIAEARYDIASNLLLESWNATSFDSLGRVTGKAYNDGTTESFMYACCYLESETDRDGVTTTYSETPGGQVKTRTRFGITEITTYDPMGRLLKRIRKGTDNSEITLEDNNYNLAGELISSKNALDRETLYAEQQGAGTTKTTTFPDGGAQIEATAGDDTLLSVSGTAVAPVKYEPGIEEDMQVVKEIKVGDGGTETEWTKTFKDMLGRNVKTVAANGAIRVNVYNVQGQLIKTIDPDNVTTLFAYNAAGEQTAGVVDIDRDGEIDWSGNDRITTAERSVLAAHGTTVRRTVTSKWATTGVDVGMVVSTLDASVDGLRSWQTAFGRMTTSVAQRLGGGDKIVTTTAPDGTYVIEQHDAGQFISTARFDSNNNQVGATNFTYDAHGRPRTQTDARTGTTTTAYNGDQVASVSAPNPSGTGAPLVTVYDYDGVGRRTSVQLPDGTWTYTVYDFRGNLTRNYGSQTYDVSYTFDSQNRMKTMITMGQAGNAVTTWNYDPQTGRLANKRYADNKGPSYTYTLGGKLLTRTWARLSDGNPLLTAYGYNNAGELTSVDYSDSTPDVIYTHDRLGRPASVTDATGTRTFTYRASDLQLAGETIASFDRVLTRKFDSLARDAGFTLGTVATPATDHEVTYGYGAAGRLNSVADAGGTHNYAYIPNSSLRASLTSPYHATLYTYEPGRDALLSVENKVGITTVSRYAYEVNAIGQRKNVVQTGTAFSTAAFNLYNYNATGEVTTAERYEGTNVGDTTLPVSDYAFAYSYDSNGNRTYSESGTATSTSYASNALNQYVSTTNPSQTFIHDADGNLISNGDWTYSWDGENRLVEAANSTSGVTAYFSYDYQSRRFRKTVTTSGAAASDKFYLYDGCNLVAAYDYQPSTSHLLLFTTYTWGLDISGNLQGVGGVGDCWEVTILRDHLPVERNTLSMATGT